MIDVQGFVVGFVEEWSYLGVYLVLLMASCGVPIPEEAPIVAAAVLSHYGLARWWLAVPVCYAGILSGDVILYWVGFHFGVRALRWRPVRFVLSVDREVQLAEAYRRHAVKTIFVARHMMGLRAAAFLTAGIARVGFWKFIAVDAVAALLGLPVSFGLAYFFTDQVTEILTDVHRAERWFGVAVAVVIAAALVFLMWRKRRKFMTEVIAPPPDEKRQPPDERRAAS